MIRALAAEFIFPIFVRYCAVSGAKGLQVCGLAQEWSDILSPGGLAMGTQNKAKTRWFEFPER